MEGALFTNCYGLDERPAMLYVLKDGATGKGGTFRS